MSDELVTVATLNTPVEASLVRNQLEAEGIRAFLSDAETVGMVWYMGNAVGGIKVQVAESDVDRAFEILDAHEPVTITEEDWQTAESEDDDWNEGAGNDFDQEKEEDGEEEQPVSEFDEMVDRAYKAAFLGVLFIPLQVYSLSILVTIFFGSTPLNPENRRKVKIAFLIDLAMAGFLFYAFYTIFYFLWDFFMK
ncbi:MAG: DUF2007 domain-containing protein [Planctomycetes bacterium]|nr:DUF2007 domain-containing protein [Planctomycetota bacterium]MCH9724247.1 DUF2007 domain-containing protein [Planctomycetota bacterium]MCH9778958.1 DUF2007 domain-containing protein [Planctomycetota bacterium]MCH9791733.1 DUF2007 domain-containing protein [Planctomycetota bacterium]